MTARRQVRLAVLAALQGARLGCTIYSPGDWETAPENMPAILLRATSDRKTGVMPGQPEFNTSVGIQLEARLEAGTAEAAQDAIEGLSYRIECAILTNYELLRIVQSVPSVDSTIEISAGGRQHLAGVLMNFTFEVFEAFDPFAQSPNQPVAVPLTEVRSDIDGLVGIAITPPQ
jgi:hypothetical protein